MNRILSGDIIECLHSLLKRNENCGCITDKERSAIAASLYVIENMTNLQMALYDQYSLYQTATCISLHCCFDDKTGTIIPFGNTNCIGCMFNPTLEEGADGVDCPDKFRPWLMKKITEV